MRYSKFFRHPYYLLASLISKDHLKFIPDKVAISLLYHYRIGYWPNLKDPKSFNEKLQWLKLHDRRLEYTSMVDKFEAKKWVANKIGEQFIIPTLGVWNKFDDIDFDLLPEQFVLKCTHDSGGLIIVRDKMNFNKDDAKMKINKCLKRNYFWSAREWPYKKVEPRIIAEKYMVDDYSYGMMEELLCSDDFAKAMFIASDKQLHSRVATVENIKYKRLTFTNGHPNNSKEVIRPDFYKLHKLAEKLSKNIPQVHVNYYDINGQVYFCELNLQQCNGIIRSIFEKWDKTHGHLFKLLGAIEGYLIADNGFILWVNFIEETKQKNSLTDYKFYCFDGEPKFLYISKGLENHTTARISFLTLDWQFASYERNDYKPFDNLPPKPECYNNMIELCRELSKGIPFLRVDLYQIAKKIYFSELTFTPCSGYIPFRNMSHDIEIGNMLEIPYAIK